MNEITMVDSDAPIIYGDDPTLPPQWRKCLSRHRDRWYYYNTKTRESVWNREEVDEWVKKKKLPVNAVKPMRAEGRKDDEQIQSSSAQQSKDNKPSQSSSSIRTQKIVAVFDTCALIHGKEMVDTTIRYNAIAVIPFAVMRELDGLKKGERCRFEAVRIHNQLDRLSAQSHPLLILESGKEESLPMDEIECVVEDDRILKCALRINKYMTDGSKRIVFVTNDLNLRIKTRSYDIESMGADEFVSLLKSVKEKDEKRRNKEEMRREENRIEANRGKGKKKKNKKKSTTEEVDDVIWLDDDETSKKKKEDEEDEVQIVDPSNCEEGLHSDDDIIELNPPESRPVIPDHVWDEYAPPSAAEVFYRILRETPAAIHAVYLDQSISPDMRAKALNDMRTLATYIEKMVNGRDPNDFMPLYNNLQELHQFYVLRSSFPPRKLSEADLTTELGRNVDAFYSTLSEALQFIMSLQY